MKKQIPKTNLQLAIEYAEICAKDKLCINNKTIYILNHIDHDFISFRCNIGSDILYYVGSEEYFLEINNKDLSWKRNYNL